MTDRSRLSIGIAGATDPAIVVALAPQIEAAGFRGLWANDTADGDSLEVLRVAASVTTTLQLASGVIPLDRRPASEILRAIEGLPTDRLTLGIGSCAALHPVERVADGVAELKAGSNARVVVGALGPRMRRLAAQASDGVLLNWLTPEAAAGAMRDLHRDAGSRTVRGIVYARTAIDPEAAPILRAEAASYNNYAQYAKNFAREGIDAIDATIDGTDREVLRARAAQYLGVVDELVFRAVLVRQTEQAYADFVRGVSL